MGRSGAWTGLLMNMTQHGEVIGRGNNYGGENIAAGLCSWVAGWLLRRGGEIVTLVDDFWPKKYLKNVQFSLTLFHSVYILLEQLTLRRYGRYAFIAHYILLRRAAQSPRHCALAYALAYASVNNPRGSSRPIGTSLTEMMSHATNLASHRLTGRSSPRRALFLCFASPAVIFPDLHRFLAGCYKK